MVFAVSSERTMVILACYSYSIGFQFPIRNRWKIFTYTNQYIHVNEIYKRRLNDGRDGMNNTPCECAIQNASTDLNNFSENFAY